MLSPSPVILSEAKNLIPLPKVNSAKHPCQCSAETLRLAQGDRARGVIANGANEANFANKKGTLRAIRLVRLIRVE